MQQSVSVPAPQRITSAQNPLIRHMKKLADQKSYRREQREFLCDGYKLLTEALSSDGRISTLLFADGVSLPPLPDEVRRVSVPAGLLSALSPSETPQGVLFSCRMPEPSPPSGTLKPGHYLVLDGVQDPGNVGTILRTADAFKADGVFLLPGCADPYNPKTIRATMGSVFRQPFQELSPDELKAFLDASGIPLFAAMPGGDAVDIRQKPLRCAAVVIGSEGRGISPKMLSYAAGKVSIPMPGRSESLNAAIAAALMLWEMIR
jgi:TrmH family RNA methyltransferase